MRRLVCVSLAIVLLALLAGSACAWEFKMKGEAEYRYRYWSRLGTNDIFGKMGDDVYLGINHLQTFPTTATTNRAGQQAFNSQATFGVLVGEPRFGADMQKTDYRMTLYPTIIVNKAIEISSSMNLTSLGIWSDGQPLVGHWSNATSTNVGYVNSLYVPLQDRPVAVDVPNTYVTLQWLKVGVKTPMMDFSLGYKTSAIGMGLWKHNGNRASASFGVSAKYGPFKIGFSPYFGREQSAWALGTASSRNTGNGASERQDDRRDYFKAVFGEVEYNSGDLSMSIVSDSYHQPTSQSPGTRGAAISATSRPNEDILRYRLALALKYNNGRFFFNGEADWFNRWRSGRGTGDNANRVRQNRDNEAWLYGAEMGVYGGPSKLTINYVRATGDDPSTRHQTEDAADGEQGLNACYMKEWGYLMYYMYGTGDGWDAAGYGQPTNFHHVGGKIDYAIAANLNFFAVYSYAWRDQPNAYRLGGDYRIGAQAWTNDDIWNQQQGTFRGQAVPDSARDIGWEVDLGVNWKLLENLTWNSVFAYWQPGTWWSYAYPNSAAIYRSFGPATSGPTANPMNTAAGEARAIWGAGREIDPLFAVETNLLIQF